MIYLTFGAAIAASIVGLIAIKKQNERAIGVYLVIPPGLIFMLAIVGFGIANLTR